MEEIKFVDIGYLSDSEMEAFGHLTDYEKEHPFHRLHDYVMQFYGGLREDVFRFLCDEGSVKKLAASISLSQEPGLQNEWYRRLIRLLQCNAEVEWYQLFFISDDKSPGYVQYFWNQLAGYAESGAMVQDVKAAYRECNAAYLLEYRVRCSKEKKRELWQQAEVKENVEFEEKEENLAENQGQLIETLREMLEPVMEGQRQILDKLQSTNYLNGYTVETKAVDADEVFAEVEASEEKESIEAEKLAADIQAVGENEAEKEDGEKIEIVHKEEKSQLEKALHFAKLFQQIRIKRKSVRLRRMDQKQQLQELVIQMNKDGFSSDDMGIVRSLIDKEVSLEFLYAVIVGEQEPVKVLKQMLDFLEAEHCLNAE